MTSRIVLAPKKTVLGRKHVVWAISVIIGPMAQAGRLNESQNATSPNLPTKLETWSMHPHPESYPAPPKVSNIVPAVCWNDVTSLLGFRKSFGEPWKKSDEEKYKRDQERKWSLSTTRPLNIKIDISGALLARPRVIEGARLIGYTV